MPSTSTRCWNRSTLTPASAARPCRSWTRSSTTSSSASQPSRPVWHITIAARPSRAEKSRRPSDSSCPENWPSTQSAKEPRLSPSTPVPSKRLLCSAIQTPKNGSYQSHKNHTRRRPHVPETRSTRGGERKLCHLHLQGVETGPPWHRHQQQGHVDHELVRQRHLRAHRSRVVSGTLQSPLDHHEQRNSSDSSCPENWPSTQSAKEPRLSPSTPVPSAVLRHPNPKKRLLSEPQKSYKKKLFVWFVLAFLINCYKLSH